VYGVYHNRVHSSLGCSPIERYAQGILGTDTMPGRGSIPSFTDPERIRTDFLPVVERTIQYNGVSIDGIEYYADVLRRYVGSTDPNQKRNKRLFRFRRDPRDISTILFYEPELERYFKIPYRDASRPPISLWDLRATKAFLKKQGRNEPDEIEVFRAYDEMRRIEDVASETTKKARLQRAKRRDVVRSRGGAADIARKPKDELASNEMASPSPVKPFEEIERY
jgi:putative transposase